MSSSPTFIVRQTEKEGEKEELLAIGQGRNHTSSPRSRPNSRLERFMIDMARSIDQKIESFARALTEQTRSQLELVRSPAEVANNNGTPVVRREISTWHP